MSLGLEIGFVSIVAIIVLIYAGVYVPIALGMISFVGVWVMRDNFAIAEQLLVLAATQAIAEYELAVIPLFVLMGIIVSESDLGRESYEVANHVFRRVRGGLGIATVAANAIFAAITGVSIASVTVFTKISVPEMLRFGYTPRFAVGVVAGSSVLGMLIPPSVLLIIYALVNEQSVGAMFIAGIVPGLILSFAFCALIIGMTYVVPHHVGGPAVTGQAGASVGAAVTGSIEHSDMGILDIIYRIAPVVIMVTVVLGGIYGGIFTATEAGAAGALIALIIATIKRKLSWQKLWRIMVETGQITASILFLVIAATMYSRMLGVTGLPTLISAWIGEMDASYTLLIVIYLILLLILGTILDSISILLIAVPLFIPIFAPFNIDLIWFGIISVIAIEIGLLTPPVGLTCYVMKSTLNDDRVSLADIFIGAAPFAATMLLVLILLVAIPDISVFLLYIN